MTKNIKYYLSLPYKTILEFENADSTWVAYCPELGRGTCYGIGETQSEALENLNEAKAAVFQLALDEGYEISEPFNEPLPSGQFVLRVPKTLHKDLKNLADSEGVSLNQFVLTSISETVGGKKFSQKTRRSSVTKGEHKSKVSGLLKK